MHDDAIKQFSVWYQDACDAAVPKPNAMTLATVSKAPNGDAKVSARIVLLAGFNDQGFIFYTNYKSSKALEIDNCSWSACVFWWDALTRQVRLEGKIEKISAEVSDKYFSKRPRGSQLGAWVSDQSVVIENRSILDEKMEKYTGKYQGKDVPRPSHWGGYRLIPESIEFWQGQENRLHDRILYSRLDRDSWSTVRLAP